MEDETIKKLYRQYLEDTLELKYKRMIIERESLKYNSKYYLKIQNDNNKYAYEKFDSMIELENGNYLGVKDNECVFYDSEGKELKRYENVKINEFHNGYAIITSTKEPKLSGYVNMNGKLISEMKWGSGCRNFECGRALVSGVKGNELGKYGYIDEQGTLIIPFTSIRSYSFSDDVCCIEKEGRNYFYDKNGNELFHDVLCDNYFHNGLVRFEGVNAKYGFKNKKGEVVIKPKYERVSTFNNGLAKTSKGHINLSGDSVRVAKFEDGVEYIKGILKPSYYNSVLRTYDKMECIPYRDLGDYLICIKDSKYVIYSKESQVYTNTNIQHISNEISVKRKGNLLEINNHVFKLSPSGCIELSTVLDVENISSYSDEDVMSYDSFVASMRKDKDFFKKVREETDKQKKERITQEVQDAKSAEDRKRQELIDKLTSIKEALNKLDDGAGDLSKIDQEILLSKVEDHYEINPEFLNQLRYLDLSYIDFENVKVSGIDFSGSNASLNPQLVYNKDMSHGKYDGLSFISSDFRGVNITGSTFEKCIMDFAQMDGAINESGKNI